MAFNALTDYHDPYPVFSDHSFDTVGCSQVNISFDEPGVVKINYVYRGIPYCLEKDQANIRLNIDRYPWPPPAEAWGWSSAGAGMDLAWQELVKEEWARITEGSVPQNGVQFCPQHVTQEFLNSLWETMCRNIGLDIEWITNAQRSKIPWWHVPGRDSPERVVPVEDLFKGTDNAPEQDADIGWVFDFIDQITTEGIE